MERFDRETLLDLTVNVIPLVIILFFVVLFVVISPFGFSAVDTTIQFALLLGPFAALAILTYYAGKAISADEEKLEGRPGEYANVAETGVGGEAGDDHESDAEHGAEESGAAIEGKAVAEADEAASGEGHEEPAQ